jgi:hypothetical protein
MVEAAEEVARGEAKVEARHRPWHPMYQRNAERSQCYRH